MGNIFNEDFQDFIKAFNEAKVDYILVGGYSVILHGHNRSTGDMDIWVRKSEENFHKINVAFSIFKMPMFDMTLEKFMSTVNDVFTFGRSPVAIDIITELKGLSFTEAFSNATLVQVENIEVRLIHLNDLINAKKASARPRDIDDINHLKHE
ncbi:MAG: nucleotidyltransferase [Bacteroidota bacterium]